MEIFFIIQKWFNVMYFVLIICMFLVNMNFYVVFQLLFDVEFLKVGILDVVFVIELIENIDFNLIYLYYVKLQCFVK